MTKKELAKRVDKLESLMDTLLERLSELYVVVYGDQPEEIETEEAQTADRSLN